MKKKLGVKVTDLIHTAKKMRTFVQFIILGRRKVALDICYKQYTDSKNFFRKHAFSLVA